MSFDWSIFYSAISGAVIGGTITGYFTLLSTNKNYRNQLDQARGEEEKLIKGLLQAIHDEVETLLERYQEIAGTRLESLKDGEPLLFFYPLTGDYFTVYNGNSFLIGRVPDNDLRKQIIKTYTLAKGMVDSFRMNNDFLQKYEYCQRIAAESHSVKHQLQVAAHYNGLV